MRRGCPTSLPLACAVHSTLSKGETYTTLEIKVNLVRPLTKDTGPVRAEGRIIHRGRTLGVPTANLEVPTDRAAPADGVYAGWVRVIDGECPRMPAAISVGDNPQYAGTRRRIEAHVIDRDDLDLYGAQIEVGFTHRLRGQEVFESQEAFVAQMRAGFEQPGAPRT